MRTWKARVAVRKALLELYAAEQRAKLIADAIAKQGELLKVMDATHQAAGSESAQCEASHAAAPASTASPASIGRRQGRSPRPRLARRSALGMSTNGLIGCEVFLRVIRGCAGCKRGAHRHEALTHRADVIEALANLRRGGRARCDWRSRSSIPTSI